MKVSTPTPACKTVNDFKGIFPKWLSFVFVLLAGFVSLNTMGQTTVTLGGEGTITCPATPTATWTTPPTGVSFNNLTRGAGVTCASASDGLSGSGFNTASPAASFTANKYFAVTITADATHYFTLNSITWLTTLSGTAAGATFTIQYSNNGGAVTTFGTASQTNATTNTFTGSVTVAAGTSIVIYAVVANAGQAGGTVRFKNASTFVLTAAATSAPTVTTTTASSITTTGASSGGNVTSDGGVSVTARGVAFGTSANPTSGTSDGTGTGSFTSTLSSLSVNTQYFYRAYATNTIGTSYGSESNFFTLANAPGTVTVNNPTTTSLDVTLAGGDGNPSTTEYAIQETGSGNYVQAGGSLGASPVWQTASTWGTKTVTGLGVNTNNTFQAKARNGASVETAFGGSAGLYTLANTPGAPTVASPTSSSLDVTVTLNGNPVSTQYAIQETGGNYVQTDGSLAASLVWQTASTWGTKTVTGLTPATLYTFQVKARNGNNVETGFGATQGGTTNAANQPELSETTLNGFGNVCINTTSAAHTFTITGTDLTTADVTVGPLSGYSFSTDDNIYTASLTIPQAGGSFSQLIYVKFSPTSVISYDGNIAVGGGGATSDNVAATGSGINTAPTVTAGAATNVTINSATIPGTITSEGCSAITAYGAEYSINAGFANGTGVQFPGSNLSLGSFSVDISVLNSGTQYYYHTYATNGGGTAYSSQGTFTTLTPTLSTDALTAFGAVCTGTTTTAHTFTITGSNLSTADVTVATLNGYSYSTDDVNYFPSLTITQPGGAFSQLIYVKFSPTLVQSYNGTIVVGGGGAANSNVSASGSGINTAPAVTTGSSSGVTQTSATLNGTITDNGCTAISAYGIEYSTLNGFTNGTGTQVAGGTLTLGAYSSAVSGLNPGVTYYYKAYATNAGGTSYGTQQSFATSALDAPVATAATDNNTGTSFTANWQAVSGATSYRLDVSTSPTFGNTVTATDLFFSEYVEGSSNNKYVEIYNGTGAPVNLGDYRLRLYANGVSTPTSDVLLSGSLANGATIVYKNSAATIYGGTSTTNAAVNYNGDDALALFKVSTASNVDIFGRIGEDPGTNWAGGGNTTLDKTLVRNASVTGGVTVNPASGFPTLGTEWTQSNIDVVSNLGSHTFTSFNPSFVPGYNNLTVNGLSQSVTGLTSNVTYHYRVRAFSTTSTSGNSNVIDVTTPCVATVTASAGANGTVIPTGATNYNCGDNAVYTITPNTCYDIADVVVDGVSQGATNSYTFTNITAGAHTISATFVLTTYTVSAFASGTGTITPSGASIVNCGDDITYTITPGACHSIGDVLVDGVSVGAVSSYTFNGVNTNHTISVNFILTPYTITVTSGVGGTILPGSGSVDCGTDANYTITPDPCYTIANVLVDGVSVGAVPSFLFTNVTANHTISATFTLTNYTITASAGPNGSVTPAGPSVVGCGTDNVYNITPAACYHIDDVLVDGVSQGPITTYTFTNTVANHSISATFAINASLTTPVVTGPTNVCPYIGNGTQVVYTASSAGATGYNWVIPPTNVTIISGQGTSTLTVTFQNGFAAQANKQIRVTATSSCGNSPLTIYYLLVQTPSTPQPIVGNTNVCPIVGTTNTYTYTIASVPGASEYVWIAQAGNTTINHPNGPGVNDTTVTISFGSGFTTSALTVAAANGCGTSPARSLTLTKIAPSTPGIISAQPMCVLILHQVE
ncbi:MAG: lamin tail domain-containing protein [Ferruginibacter sp.]